MKNKHISLIAILFSFLCVSLDSTAGNNRLKFGNEAFKKGDNAINFGLGVGGYYVGSYTSGYVALPAFSLSYERGIVDDLGPGNLAIGGYLGFQHSYYDGKNYTETWNSVYFGVRAAYHYNFNLTPKFDTYAGVLVGGRSETYSSGGVKYGNNYGGFYPNAGVFVGARYQFAKALGAFAEAGRGITFLTIGLDLKF